MNIVRKDHDSVNATLTISIEKADYSEKVEKTLRDYRKKANIPGFRPGMVPMGLLKKMYGKSILADEINKMLSDELYKYIRENNINILGEPLPNEEEQKEIDFNTQEDFEFSFDLGLAPEFEVELNKKDKVKFYHIAASDEMVNNQVKSYTGRYGKYAQEETVEEKDMVKGLIVELEGGQVKEDGIQVSDAVLTPAYMKDEASKNSFVGKKVGDQVTFNPKTAFENEAEIASLLKVKKEELAGLSADFLFTIESNTRYHEAEVNQELFDKVYGDGVVTSEEEFIARIKATIEEQLQQDSNYKFGIDAREALIKKYNDLVFPDAFLKRWLLATNKELTAEKIEEDYPKMIADLKWQLIKDKIARANNVQVENEDVQAYGRQVARAQFAQYGMTGLDDAILDNYAKDMFKNEEQLRNIIDRVAENKVIDIVKNTVKLDTKEVSIEEFNKMFE
ncbi:MAG: trigger factor [Bacteroidales bacterium]|jgi:trigger factor|nr:trigger factor [Bacteroidales bacterium]ODT54938.1 MAG: trigger factor [Paludibacter sp. SCN 50-10]OJX87754.1 MAG: trigger factor [Paludibacter sp. 47-17]